MSWVVDLDTVEELFNACEKELFRAGLPKACEILRKVASEPREALYMEPNTSRLKIGLNLIKSDSVVSVGNFDCRS